MKVIRLLLVGLMVLNFTTYKACPVMAAPAPQEKSQKPLPTPEVVGAAAVLIDSVTGQILYAKNENQQMYPASTTKILTTLLGLEKGGLTDRVTIGPDPVRVGGSSVYLQEGETLTLEELLYSAMLNSANDATVAIAEHIGGSVENFAQMMNAKAKSLGAVNSHFNNPNGLPDTYHYTTAHDLALIAKAAMENPKFREIVASKTKDISRTPADALTRLINHNKLLWNYEGANGIKTGYTVVAQQCLVGSAQRGDKEYIAVVLGSVGKSIWQDVRHLLDYGFDNFQLVELTKANQMIKTITVKNSDQVIQAVTAYGRSYSVPVGTTVKPTARVQLLPNLQAPVNKGTKVGTLIYSAEGQEIGRVDLVAANSITLKKSVVAPIVWSTAGGILLLTVGMMVAATVSRSRRRKLRKRRALLKEY
ncbi:MAG TPA: D-alanyl-D-alanine carboxypeptidase family protein [Bacillota bacterium]|nr:D-alanyl-D-alanine carboxypeptidase family protein [Bacillota bacterium]